MQIVLLILAALSAGADLVEQVVKVATPTKIGFGCAGPRDMNNVIYLDSIDTSGLTFDP